MQKTVLPFKSQICSLFTNCSFYANLVNTKSTWFVTSKVMLLLIGYSSEIFESQCYNYLEQ